MLKKIEPHRVQIGDVNYAIYPFSAFRSAGIAGDLGRFIGPIVAGILPFVGGDMDIETLLSADVDKLVPLVNAALSKLDSATVEKILMELLINEKNIACEYREDGRMVQAELTKELADEMFIGGLPDMIKLAIEVVKFNYGNFFTGLADQSGSQADLSRIFTSKTTESSTETVTLI